MTPEALEDYRGTWEVQGLLRRQGAPVESRVSWGFHRFLLTPWVCGLEGGYKGVNGYLGTLTRITSPFRFGFKVMENLRMPAYSLSTQTCQSFILSVFHFFELPVCLGLLDLSSITSARPYPFAISVVILDLSSFFLMLYSYMPTYLSIQLLPCSLLLSSIHGHFLYTVNILNCLAKHFETVQLNSVTNKFREIGSKPFSL
jgi:hypothetical protein